MAWNLTKSIFCIWISTKKKQQAFDFLISSISLKAVYFSFHWFDDSWTRGFELLTRGFELVTRRLELVTGEFELVTRGFELVTCGFQLTTRGFELVTHGFELVTR